MFIRGLRIAYTGGSQRVNGCVWGGWGRVYVMPNRWWIGCLEHPGADLFLGDGGGFAFAGAAGGGDADCDFVAYAVVAVAGADAAEEGEVGGVGDAAGDVDGGTGDVDGPENRVAGADSVLEGLVVHAVAPGDAFGAAGEAEVAADFEEVDVFGVGEAFVVLEVGEFAAEAFLGEEAAASGAGVFFDAEFGGEGDLGFAGASGEVEELGTVDFAFEFGVGGFEEERGEGAQEAALEAGIFLDEGEGLFCLGHGALVEDFAGGDEVVAEFLHELAGAFDHAGVAVNAGVHAAAEAVWWFLDEFDDVGSEVNGAQGDVELRGGFLGGAGVEEGAGVDDGVDVDALFA